MFTSRRISDTTYIRAVYMRAVDAFGMQTMVELIAIMGYDCMVVTTTRWLLLHGVGKPQRIRSTPASRRSVVGQENPALDRADHLDGRYGSSVPGLIGG